MKLLLLNGHGISLRISNAQLVIKDGRTDEEEPIMYTFRPKRIDVDNIVIYGRTGNITLDAIRWLVKHNVQATFLNWDGKLLTTLLPPESVQVKTKFAQYRAFSNTSKRITIAKKILSAKFAKTKNILEYLKQRYPDVNTDIKSELKRFTDTTTIPHLLTVEGRIAQHYWQQLYTVIPDSYEFDIRKHNKRPKGAGDVINCLLNYGYAILEAECLRAINTAGLDPHIGFLHEAQQGKNSLAYDLQEPYRFLIDLAVFDVIEHKAIQKSDFIRTENYTLRLKPSGAKKLLTAIEQQFARKVTYANQKWSWRYVIQNKTRELAHYLIGKRQTLDFAQPTMQHKRNDTEGIRTLIKRITYREWTRHGYSKSSLHHLKTNAQSSKPFTVRKEMKQRLLAWHD